MSSARRRWQICSGLRRLQPRGCAEIPCNAHVTRGASAGGGNLTLDLLYLSDGWLRHSSENRANNINTIEAYHEIRGNLKKIEHGGECVRGEWRGRLQDGADIPPMNG